MRQMLGKAFGAVALTLAMGTASAALITLGSPMSGAVENPVNASPATGVVFVDIDTIADTMRVRGSFTGLIGNTTMAHIHCCVLPPGNVGVATTVPSLVGFPLGVTAGVFDSTLDLRSALAYNPAFLNNAMNLGSLANARNTLVNGLLAGQAYFNVHTTAFPGGEIRGFPLVVPEPWTLALMGVGLLAGAAATRRRH